MPTSTVIDDTDSSTGSHSSLGTSTDGNGDAGVAAATTVAAAAAGPEGDRPIFPLLHNNTTTDSVPLGTNGAAAQTRAAGDDNYDDEPAVAQPFHRTTSPNGSAPNGAGGAYEDEEDGTPAPEQGGGSRRQRLSHKMHKFSLYETASRYYIVGGDITEKRFRVLKIDRSAAEDSELSVTDDKIVYSQKEMSQLLDTIDDGNKGTGGIRLRCTAWGLLGFIKFTGSYYMLLITKKSTVAVVGGHFIYQIDGTELVPLATVRGRSEQRNAEEARFLNILHNLDLTRSFYYSYSYDITHTLQYNITREREALARGGSGGDGNDGNDYNLMFVWNSHLLQPAIKSLGQPFDWCRPIMHGYIDQASVDIYGRTAYITIMARRSRFFAGARFLKRGANDLGYVANDVETEQIVSETATTSFHGPGPRLFASPLYTSYVQHRGSIPLYWTQDATGVTPKPPIELNLVDPFYGAAALHFDDLFARYGAPIFVLDLVKARERTPRESKLLAEFTRAIDYLNQFLPGDKKIVHRTFDMARAAKSRDQDVIGVLEGIAKTILDTTGFFKNGDGDVSPALAQNGVARTNCIDCLDRTNAAQFVIAKEALGRQLHALGILEGTEVAFETDTLNLFTHMYHDHGDTIAVQYGGSQLVNTMETYRKINQWTSHSRDMIESFKRYYNNSFMDGQRQEAYNLFLGNYIFARGQPMLWDLVTDYYLHHTDPRGWIEKRKPDYIRWYTPDHLRERTVPAYVPFRGALADKPTSYFDNYWLEYYRPFALSSFSKMFPYRMHSTIKFIPFKSSQEGRYDLSPFKVRSDADTDATATAAAAAAAAASAAAAADKKKIKKEVTILAPRDVVRLAAAAAADDDDAASIMSGPSAGPARGIRGWLQPNAERAGGGGGGGGGGGVHGIQGIMKEGTEGVMHHLTAQQQLQLKVKASPQEKTRAEQATFTRMVRKSLSPAVDDGETLQYARYISHPQSLPLVVSSDVTVEGESNAYVEYLNGSWQNEELMPFGGEEEAAVYAQLLKVGENPLTVTEEDALKKRYRAYGKWLMGKSLFKSALTE